MQNRLITGKPSPAARRWQKGNPVGSRHTTLGTVEEAYFVGLWRADGYSWSSSIGVSNTDWRLAKWTSDFLAKICGTARVRWRAYLPIGTDIPVQLKMLGQPYVVRPGRKAKQVAYHVYVNHRPYLRQVHQWVSEMEQWPQWAIWPYFAGRFDGDGSVAANGRWGARIAYGSSEEALADQAFMIRATRIKTRVYRFKAARTSVLYVLKQDTPTFLDTIQPFSIKLSGELDPVETDSRKMQVG